jgi:hypothetical protein
MPKNKTKRISKIFISLLAILAINSMYGQTPTHIDPGTSDESISIFEQPVYLLLIVALIVLLVAVYAGLKRRGK